MALPDLPADLLDLVVNDFDGEEEDDEEDYRFGNITVDELVLLTSKNVAENTARKIRYVINLWRDWVRF